MVDLTDLRSPKASDLRLFLSLLVRDPNQWIGSIKRKPGLFFTPNPIPDRFRYLYESPQHAGAWPPKVGADDKFATYFVESDDRLEDQIERLNAFPVVPSAAVLSGDSRFGTAGRSLHLFWDTVEPVPYPEWLRVQTGLVGFFDGDPCVTNPLQMMRVGGFAAQNLSQTLVHWRLQTPGLAELAAAAAPHFGAGEARIAERRKPSSGS